MADNKCLPVGKKSDGICHAGQSDDSKFDIAEEIEDPAEGKSGSGSCAGRTARKMPTGHRV